MLLKDELPRGINHLRIGEGYPLARETSYGEPIPTLTRTLYPALRSDRSVQEKLPPQGREVGLNAAGEQQTLNKVRLSAAFARWAAGDVIPKGLQPKLPGSNTSATFVDHTIFKLSGAGASFASR